MNINADKREKLKSMCLEIWKRKYPLGTQTNQQEIEQKRKSNKIFHKQEMVKEYSEEGWERKIYMKETKKERKTI